MFIYFFLFGWWCTHVTIFAPPLPCRHSSPPPPIHYHPPHTIYPLLSVWHIQACRVIDTWYALLCHRKTIDTATNRRTSKMSIYQIQRFITNETRWYSFPGHYFNDLKIELFTSHSLNWTWATPLLSVWWTFKSNSCLKLLNFILKRFNTSTI